MKSNASWKTTLLGMVVGALPIINALIDAYNSGAFTGKSAMQCAAGIGIVIFGVVSKDADKTGLPGDVAKPAAKSVI